MSTSVAPMPASAARVLPSISSLSGQAGVVSSMVNATAGAVDDDRLDHVQGDDVPPELGLLDVAQRVEDGGFGEAVIGWESAGRSVTVDASISYRAGARAKSGRGDAPPDVWTSPGSSLVAELARPSGVASANLARSHRCAESRGSAHP